MLTGGFKRQTSAAVPSPLAADSNNLSGSMRKRIVLNKQFISVQKEDGDIGHIEVKIGDEELSGVQPILRSLSEMGGIDNSSKPGSPVPGRGSLKGDFFSETVFSKKNVDTPVNSGSEIG